MKIVSLLILVSSFLLAEVSYRDVSYNPKESAPEMPDENSTKVEIPKNSLPYDQIYSTQNLESNTTINKEFLEDGSVMFYAGDINGSDLFSVTAPEKCLVGGSTEESMTTLGLKSMRLVVDKKVKRIALGLLAPTTAEEHALNDAIIIANRCIEVVTENDESVVSCGRCVDYMMPKLSSIQTNEDNETYYSPNNAKLKQMYQHQPSRNASSALITKLIQNSELASRVNITGPDSIDPTVIPSDLSDSQEANNTIKAKQLKDTLASGLISSNITKCFVRRELVPQFYCPIPGMEGGAKTGGQPEDDLKKAKEDCDSYCQSESYSCNSVDTGFSTIDNISTSISFSFSQGMQQEIKEIVIPINTDLEMKKLSYAVNLSYVEEYDENTTESIRAKIQVQYRLKDHTDFTAVNGPNEFMLDGNITHFSIPQIPQAQEVKLTFYTPYVYRGGVYSESEIWDVVSSMSVNGFEVEYTDDKYYFCSIDQIVIDPTTQCIDGEAYELNSTAGTSIVVCKSDKKIQGPEDKFGGFFTQDSCEASCKIKRECVETYSNYQDNPLGTNAYAITVGCVTDPLNTNCSPQMCEEMFNNDDMPVEEYVYDSKRTERKTVTSGVQIADEIRPKVNLAAEQSATTADDYRGVFLDEMKDGAYQAMISRRSYDYVNTPVGVSTPFEYAYREEDNPTDNTAYLTAQATDINIFWKLKPRSFDIKSGNNYYLYKIIKSEQAFKPISGAFSDTSSGLSNQITYSSQRNYKDMVYSFVTPSGNIPFFIKEYAEVYMDGNASAGELSGWVTNSQHAGNRFIAYDATNDVYVASSDTTPASYADTVSFDGSKNYEEYQFIQNAVDFLTNQEDGGCIQSQSSPNESALPLKHYAVDTKTENQHGAIVNYHLYGIYSLDPLTVGDVMDMLDAPDGEKYLVYRATKGSDNKSEIYGDGVNRKDRLRLFVKGAPQNATMTVDVTPEIEEESKDAVFFMYMFEGDL